MKCSFEEEEFEKRAELESAVSVLQEHVYHYQIRVNECLKHENEELQQYRRRLCARGDGIPLAENKT